MSPRVRSLLFRLTTIPAGLGLMLAGPRLVWSPECAGIDSYLGLWLGVAPFLAGWLLVGSGIAGYGSARWGVRVALYGYLACGLLPTLLFPALPRPGSIESWTFPLVMLLGWPWLLDKSFGVYGGCFFEPGT